MLANIFFRVDASPIIGLGHLYRCLAIADEAKKKGFQSFFLCRENDLYNYDIVSKSSHNLILMNNGYFRQNVDHIHSLELQFGWLGRSSSEDAGEFVSLVKKSEYGNGLNIVLTDHYGIDFFWENLVFKNFDLAIKITDKPGRKTDADIIVDQTAERKVCEYNKDVKKRVSVLVGESYTLLSGKFIKRRQQYDTGIIERNFSSVKTVLVLFGGSDPLNLTSKFLKHVAPTQRQLHYVVVTGGCNPYIPQLKELVSKSNANPLSVDLLIDTNKMPDLVMSADIGIGGAGSASWERCILGLPSIVVPFEKNQLDVSNVLLKQQCAIVISADDFIKQATRQLNRILNCSKLRSSLSLNSRRLIDGKGCIRLVSKIKEMIREI